MCELDVNEDLYEMVYQSMLMKESRNRLLLLLFIFLACAAAVPLPSSLYFFQTAHPSLKSNGLPSLLLRSKLSLSSR